MAEADTHLLISPNENLATRGGWINKPPSVADQRVRIGDPDARLMEAILLLCGEHGYAETSVEAVVKRAGVSRNTFYKHFADKDDCFFRAYDAGIQEFARRILAPGRAADNWRAGVRASLAATVQVLEQQPAIASCMLIEAYAAGRRAMDQRAGVLRQFAVALDRVRQTEPETAELPPLTSEIVVGGLESLVRRQLQMGDPPTPAELLPDLVYFAIRPYLGHRTATEEADLVRANARASRRETVD